MKKDFYNWMVDCKGLRETVARTNVARIFRISEMHDVIYEYFRDGCEYLLSLFSYSKQDEKNGITPAHDIVIVGNYYTGTQSLKYALKLFVEYMNDDAYFDIMLGGKSGASIGVNEVFDISDEDLYELMGELGKLEQENSQENQDVTYCEEDFPTIQSPKFIVFTGDLQSFLRYIGPFCKNYVNSITKSARISHNGICEYCGRKAVLDSAHKDGEDRPIIIKRIFETYYKKSHDYYEVDVLEFEKKFKEAHLPVHDHIFFLCKDCHTEYDRGTTINTSDILGKR